MTLRAALLALLVALLAVGPQALAAGPLVVSPEGPYRSIEAALADARPGDTVQVRGGVYAGPLVVQVEAVTLEGEGWPVIDGGGQGTVVTLDAPDIVFRGFEVRGSGSEPDHDHAGITVAASGGVVENNRLRDVLFGIFVAQADGAVVRGNDIAGKPEFDLGRKGDGIRLWYSRGVTVEDNLVHETRDVVMWYAEDVVLRNNVIEGGRYGVHLMYCDGARIENNRLLDNSVGIYVMYSNNVALRGNLLRGQRGPSGYAFGFKDADDIEATDNVLVDNGVGIFLDGTPFSPAGHARFQRNILAFNDVGVSLLPAVRGAAFQDNTFWENVEQVAVQGAEAEGQNDWRGNYWSDYTGYDADGDGLGDTPYQAERLFENLTDRAPLLRALLYSPAAQAVEFTASAFPIVRPQPKLVDPEPAIEPLPAPAEAGMPGRSSGWGMSLAAGLLTGIGALSMWMPSRALFSRRKSAPTPQREFEPRRREGREESPVEALHLRAEDSVTAISVRQVSKRYGRVIALEGISFEAGPGEALALWGANGAGKTTLLKAMLGLIEFEGEIRVGGFDVRRDGKRARRGLGYVPQETTFYDLSGQATLEFYARLKQVSLARIAPLLDRLGLAAHAHKPVSALSGGLKQRLALALALLADPPVLLLDEPTASLDAKAQSDYLGLLKSLRDDEHKAILFASHRREEVEALATRVLSLEAGRLVAVWDGPASDIDVALWVADGQRQVALQCLTSAGLAAHLNGRGTVVVRVAAEGKMTPVQVLHASGIAVKDFEVERGGRWN